MHQKSIMDQLFLKPIGNLFDLIGDVLKSRDTPLRVKKLMMTRANENEIMNILPYLDSVESIVNNYWEPDPLNLNLAEVSKLVQWRNALELEFFDCIIKNSIEELNLINFQQIDIRINSLTTDDVIYLKKNIPKSSEIEIFEITFKDSLIDDSLYTLLPPFKRVLNIRSVWYSPMLNSNEFVHISLHEQKKIITLKRVNRDSVPEELL
uniref:FTH domain-containing protein n=1 Tax=Caenorhabditis tropicalis TaxID=1561998 RepID=A0A1I7UDX6_9PELO